MHYYITHYLSQSTVNHSHSWQCSKIHTE